ncbi:MAG: hypothetical protein IJ590_04520 [Rickettsiales bacterium]|nr:hypothetical protein [Rickettsiales bacterium]
MPQLNLSFYISQICWLLASFGAFFCISKFIILPRLANILQNRENTVNDNINFANETLTKVKQITENCDNVMKITKEDCAARVAQCIAECKEKNDKTLKNLTKRMNEEAQQNIISAKQELYEIEGELNEKIINISAEILKKIFLIKDVDIDKLKEISCKVELL